MALTKRICEVCGRVYTRPESMIGGSFCSFSCKKAKLWPRSTCEVCGKVFTRTYQLKGGVFCSIACKNKKPNQVYTSNQVYTCEVCGKVFNRPYRLKGGSFCSLACKKVKLDPEHKCEVCGVVIAKQSPSTLPKKLYCSEQCREKALPQKQLENGVCISKSCKQCGESFLVKTFREERTPQEFCNVQCKKKYRRTTVSCEYCGKEFSKVKSQVDFSKKQYCSLGCRTADTLVTKTCKTCGKKYSGPPSKMRSDFCSLHCYDGSQKYFGKVTLTCQQCNREFEKDASRVHILSGTFCSKECRRDFTMPRKTCEVCGKEYRRVAQYKSGDFCSMECKKKGSQLILTCAYCQKNFKIARSKGGKFCTSKCAGLSIRKLKLRTPQKNPAGQSYCGPTVLSAITGKPYNEVLSFIDSLIGKDSARETKAMKFSDLHACLVKLGFKTEVEILDDDCPTEDLSTLEKWIEGRDFLAEQMGDDPQNDTWILYLTNHFVLVQGDLFVDSQVGKPVPISSAPGLKKRVRGAIKVF